MHFYAKEAKSHPHLSYPVDLPLALALPLCLTRQHQDDEFFLLCCNEVLWGHCVYKKLSPFVTCSISLFHYWSAIEGRERERTTMNWCQIQSSFFPFLLLLPPQWKLQGFLISLPHLSSQSISCTNNRSSSWPNPIQRRRQNFPMTSTQKNYSLIVSISGWEFGPFHMHIVTPIIRISPFHGLA